MNRPVFEWNEICKKRKLPIILMTGSSLELFKLVISLTVALMIAHHW